MTAGLIVEVVIAVSVSYRDLVRSYSGHLLSCFIVIYFVICCVSLVFLMTAATQTEVSFFWYLFTLTVLKINGKNEVPCLQHISCFPTCPRVIRSPTWIC